MGLTTFRFAISLLFKVGNGSHAGNWLEMYGFDVGTRLNKTEMRAIDIEACRILGNSLRFRGSSRELHRSHQTSGLVALGPDAGWVGNP